MLENLVDSGAQVIIAEGLNRNFLSMFLAFFGGLGVALVAPLFQFSRPGRLRRLFWCWLLPIAPLVFSVDGVTSALRCWTKREWLSALEPLLPRLAAPPELRQSLCSLAAMFKGKSAEAAPVESMYCFFFRYGRSSKPASRSDRPDVEAPQTCTVCGHVGRAGLCPDRVS